MFTSSFSPGELQGTGGKRKNEMTQHISMSSLEHYLICSVSSDFTLLYHALSHTSLFFHISVIFAPLYLLLCLNSARSDNASFSPSRPLFHEEKIISEGCICSSGTLASLIHAQKKAKICLVAFPGFMV